jgi:hypothetical protein
MGASVFSWAQTICAKRRMSHPERIIFFIFIITSFVDEFCEREVEPLQTQNIADPLPESQCRYSLSTRKQPQSGRKGNLGGKRIMGLDPMVQTVRPQTSDIRLKRRNGQRVKCLASKV